MLTNNPANGKSEGIKELDLDDTPDEKSEPSNQTADDNLRKFAAHDEALNQPQPNPDRSSKLPRLNLKKPQVKMPSFGKLGSIFSGSKKTWMGIGGVVVGIVLFFVVLGIYTFTIVSSVQAKVQEAQVVGRGALDQFKNQNLPGTETALRDLQTKVGEIENRYKKLSFYKYVPIAGDYYKDGEHGITAAQAGIEAGIKTVAAIAPYSDVLGFSGEGSFEGGTAENRVKLILQTLDKVKPVLDEVAGDLEIAENEISQINEKRYPERIGGREIRSNIVEGKELLNNASTILNDFRPIIEHLPSIAGADGERKKYLVLFQNDNELRPTGGFLTAYSVIYIEDGVVTPEKSDDIYELDKKFTERIPIPEELGRYLTTERYFNLRDMNTSPDFKTSMDLFFEHYSEVRGEPGDIDGIIAVDTHLLTELVKLVGPVEVPGYGTFTADNVEQCDCPQIIYALSEIITRPTPYIRQDRKGILAPLMQAILQRVYASPRVFMSDLFQIGLDSIEARHLQAYFFNDDHQQATEAINAGGRLVNENGAGDFFAVVNANLGGAKSNLFVSYDVLHEVVGPENGEITRTVEITYRNSRAGDNCDLEAGLLCLNSTLRDWTRIYVPEGSKLVEAQGFTEEAKEYDEAGFHVFDGFFILEPKGQAKIKVTYTVPYDAEDYSLQIWKQGGLDDIETLVDVNGGQEQLNVVGDTYFETEF